MWGSELGGRLKSGKHPEKALSAVQVRNAKIPGRYADGNGLYLVVDPSGAKRWLLRTVVKGRRRDIGLGGTSLVTLAEAREKALTYRKLARDGGDPIAQRRQTAIVVPTFAEAAERVHTDHLAGWKNHKHGAQWINTLRTYANPHLGSLRIDCVETPDVLRALSPIWLSKPETARRVRQRIGTVLDWAKAAGYRTGDNPVEGVAKGLPNQAERNSHHSAMPYDQVAAFIVQLRASTFGIIAKLAFEFLILTATRTSEVLNASANEIVEKESLWVIPAERMKAGKEQRIPLSRRCLDILNELTPYRGESNFLFPGRSAEKPLSNMAFLMMLRRMELNVTTHGFRSSFRDWAAEETNFPNEIAEMALAHTVQNKVEAAYRRGDLLAKRRELMDAWADFVNTKDRSACATNPA